MTDQHTPPAWMRARSFYGYPRGWWLTFAVGIVTVALAAVQSPWFAIFVAYALGWGHGIVQQSGPPDNFPYLSSENRTRSEDG